MGNAVDRWEAELSAARGVGAARYATVLTRVIQACRRDAAVAETFDPGELYLELTAAYLELRRFDDALLAADAGLAAGLVMTPDARCLRAEVLMRAGRLDEAEPIWAAVRNDSPDDVWLYNSAGLEYGDIGEHETALAWLTDGLELALSISDPDQLVEQLADLRAISLAAVGRSVDELQQRAAAFCGEQGRIRADRAAAVGFPTDPDWLPSEREDTMPQSVSGLVCAWLPAEDYEKALQLWPELADSVLVAGPGGPVPHAQYCRALQAQLVAIAEAGYPRLTVAPLRVSVFEQWCVEHDQTPDSAARAQYVAQMGAAEDSAMIPWPPGRNQPCWCGSGRKYKKCCAATTLTIGLNSGGTHQ